MEVIISTKASWPIPAESIKVTVVGGGGGSAISTGDAGTAGGDTSVTLQDGTKLAEATGGEQGFQQRNSAHGAKAGTGRVGDIKITGGAGTISVDSKAGAAGGSSTHGGGGQGGYGNSGQTNGIAGGYGSGGGGPSMAVFTSSGGAGGTAIAYLTGLTVGDTLNLTIGAGGPGGGPGRQGVIIIEY